MDLELTTQPEVTAPPDSKVARFKAALERKRYTLYPGSGPGDWWTYCPGHEPSGPHEPSLHVTFSDMGNEAEEVTTHCFLCKPVTYYEDLMYGHAVECTAVFRVKEKNKNGKTWGYGAVITAWEIHTEKDYHQYCEQAAREERGGLYVKTWWDYNDGEFKKVKWSNGDYVWLRRSEWQEGAYISGLRGRSDEVELYGANAIDESVETVYCVEGEKDVDTLTSLGLIAVSYHTVGKRAGKWNQCVSGRNVVVLGDNDRTGLDNVRAVCEELGASRALAVCELGVLDGGKAGSGYDVSDWVAEGNGRVALEGMVAARGFEPVAVIAGPESNADGDIDDWADTVTKEAQGSHSDSVDPQQNTFNTRALRTLRARDWAQGQLAAERAASHADDWKPFSIGDMMRGGIEIPRPNVLEMADGTCLLYSGEFNMMWGAKSAGKTWLQDLAIAQQVAAGKHVVLIDYENSRGSIAYRLKLLGVTAEQADEFLHPLQSPPGAMPLEKIPGLPELTDIGLVAIDSFTGALSLTGVTGKSVGEEIEKYYASLGPFTAAGAAVLIIDHVTMNEETQDRPAYSERKLTRIQGIGLQIVNTVSFGKKRTGHSEIILQKDNQGGMEFARGDVIGQLTVASKEDTPEDVTVTIIPIGELGGGSGTTGLVKNARETDMWRKVKSVVDQTPGLNSRAVVAAAGGNRNLAFKMLKELAAAGVIFKKEHNGKHCWFPGEAQPDWPAGGLTGSSGPADGGEDVVWEAE